MGKHKWNSGFTTIEMCFVLLLIQISVLLITFHYPSNETLQVKVMEEQLNYAQYQSMIKKEIYEISIDQSTLQINDEVIDLSPLVCESLSFHYNEKGNISQANTCVCRGRKQEYRLVFQLGSGWIRVEK